MTLWGAKVKERGLSQVSDDAKGSINRRLLYKIRFLGGPDIGAADDARPMTLSVFSVLCSETEDQYSRGPRPR